MWQGYWPKHPMKCHVCEWYKISCILACLYVSHKGNVTEFNTGDMSLSKNTSLHTRFKKQIKYKEMNWRPKTWHSHGATETISWASCLFYPSKHLTLPQLLIFKLWLIQWLFRLANSVMAFHSLCNSLRPHRLWHWDSLPALTCCWEPQVRSHSGSLSQWTVKWAQTRRSPGSSLHFHPLWLCEWHPIFPMSHRAQAVD